MPLAYGMPSDELGPDSDTLSPTFRSAADAPAVRASATAAPDTRQTRRFMVKAPGWVDASGKELDRRPCGIGLQQIDPLEPDAPRAAGFHEAVKTAAGQQQLALAARFDVDERRAQLAARAVVERDGGGLQHVLAAARRMLRVRARALQPLDAQLQQQQVFVGQRVVRGAFG